MDLPEQKKKERYNRLLHRHLRRINTICTFEARSYEDGRDLVQEVMVALWEGLENLQSDASLWQEAAWVRQVVTSTTIDRFRQRHRQRREGCTVPIEQVSELCQEEDDRTELVKERLAYLPPRERRLMEESLEGYDADELAQAHGVSANIIHQRMYRIRKKMKTIYNKLYGTE